MTEHKIKEIIEKKVGEIKRLGKEIDSGFEKKAIHDFRVEIKSLRSFLRMLHTVHKKIPSTLPDELLELYHVSGRIREAQLDAAKIKKSSYTLPAYLEKLTGDMSGGKIAWTMHYSEEIIENLGTRLLSYSYENISPEDLVAFVNSRIHKIGKLIQQEFVTDEELHQIRKWLKDIIYNIKLATKEWEEGSAAIEHVPLSELEHLTDSIGEYNDARIMREHLITFAMHTTSALDKDTIEKIVAGDAASLKAERLKIIAAIRQFTDAHIAADKNK